MCLYTSAIKKRKKLNQTVTLSGILDHSTERLTHLLLPLLFQAQAWRQKQKNLFFPPAFLKMTTSKDTQTGSLTH